MNLAGAFIDAIDSTHFVITNGPSQVYHLRALNEVERQRWVTALELAKSKAIKNLESGVCESVCGVWVGVYIITYCYAKLSLRNDFKVAHFASLINLSSYDNTGCKFLASP